MPGKEVVRSASAHSSFPEKCLPRVPPAVHPLGFTLTVHTERDCPVDRRPNWSGHRWTHCAPRISLCPWGHLWQIQTEPAVRSLSTLAFLIIHAPPTAGASLKKLKQQQVEQPWRRMGTARPVLPGFWLSWDNEVMLVPVTAPPKEDTW